MRRLILAILLAAPASMLAAADAGALAKIAGGMWEVSGVPGSHAPVRACFADVAALASFELRGKTCTRTVLSDKGSAAVISYKCGPSGFGQATMEVITPRSLKISTQGISEELPFNYVLQARRVGECANDVVSPHH